MKNYDEQLENWLKNLWNKVKSLNFALIWNWIKLSKIWDWTVHTKLGHFLWNSILAGLLADVILIFGMHQHLNWGGVAGVTLCSAAFAICDWNKRWY